MAIYSTVPRVPPSFDFERFFSGAAAGEPCSAVFFFFFDISFQPLDRRIPRGHGVTAPY